MPKSTYTKKHRNQLIYGALTPNLDADLTALFSVSAEREGFEPPVPRSTTVFKTAAIDHSATSPELLPKCFISQKRCKGIAFF